MDQGRALVTGDSRAGRSQDGGRLQKMLPAGARPQLRSEVGPGVDAAPNPDQRALPRQGLNLAG